MSAGTWQEVGAGPQLPGTQYRATMSIRAPYTDENIARLESRFREQAGGSRVVVEKFVVSFPKGGIWKATATYHVLESGAVDIGGICSDVVGFIINSTALVLTVVQKFVVDTVSGVVGGVVAPLTAPLHDVLNPGVLILVVVGIFLIVRR